MIENTKKASQSSKVKKTEDISDKVVLNFKYDDFDPNNEQYHPRFRKRQDVIEIDDVSILDQNRFHFILNNNSTFFTAYSGYNKGDYNNISWEDIKIVIYYCVENYQCPICLENCMLCPMITHCGHIFCWPCLMSYYNYYTVEAINKKIPKCPLCSNKIDLVHYKPKFCEILQCHNYSVSENNTITFNLIMRDKLSQNVYNTFYDPDLSQWKQWERFEVKNVPFEEDAKYSFGRIFYSNKELIRKRYERYKKELENGLKEELSFYADEVRIRNLNWCIDEITKALSDNEKEENFVSDKKEDNTIVNSIVKEEEPYELNLNKFFFFYQESYGDIYFLHPLIYSILLEEYKSEGDLPTEIGGKILDIEMHQITHYFKKSYSFLSHLRIGSLIFFVEIELGNLVSPKTKKKFANELRERAKYRRLLSKEEQNYEKFIKKKAIKEEKENQIIFSASAASKSNLDELTKEEEEFKKEEQEQEKIEPKESMLKKLLIDSNELERKEEEKRQLESEFMFKEEEFPELDKDNLPIRNYTQKKGKKKNKAKFKNANDELIQVNFSIDDNNDDDNKKRKIKEPKQLKNENGKKK